MVYTVGRVHRPQILRGLGYGGEVVVRVLRRTRFRPGRLRGQPVNAWLTMRFVFKIAEE